MTRAERFLGLCWHVGPAVVYAAGVFVAGSMHSPGGPQPADDKLMHALGFGVMALLVYRAWRYLFDGAPIARVIGAAVAVSLVLGALLEVWQSLLPHRTAELLDWVADALGVGLAAAATAVMSTLRARWRADTRSS